MNRSFIIASICGLVLGVLVPALLPFAIAGIVLGVAPIALRWMNSHRRRVVISALVAVPLLIVVGSALFIAALNFSGGLTGHFARIDPRITIETTYIGEGVHRDEPERLVLDDQYQIPNASFLLAAKQLRFYFFDDRMGATRSRESLQALARMLRTAVTLGLERRGWNALPPTIEETAFVDARKVRLDVPKMPPESHYTIELPKTAGVAFFDGMAIDLDLTPASRLELTAPERTFGDSFPAGTRQTRPAQDLEVLSIPGGIEEAVEVDVRSPWFRNEVLSGFAGLTVPGATQEVLGFFLLALIALFNDELKEFLKRLWKRGRRKQRQQLDGEPPRSQPSG